MSEKELVFSIFQSVSLNACRLIRLEECINIIYNALSPFIPASLLVCYFINRIRKKITVLTTAGNSLDNEEIEDENIILLSKEEYENTLFDKKNQIHLWPDYRIFPGVARHYRHVFPSYLSRLSINFIDNSENSLLSLSFCAKQSGLFNKTHASILAELRPFLSALMENFLPASPSEEPGAIFTYGTSQDDIALLRQCNGMSAVLREMEAVAPTNATVLIQGESGVGKEVVARAHAVGASVEGELGVIGSLETGKGDKEDGHGAEGVIDKKRLVTDPDEAAKFVAETKLDALAVAVGTSHGAYKFTRKPTGDILAIDVIEKIHAKLPNTHMVMHGSSSVPQELQDLINAYGGAIPQTFGVPVEEIVRGIKSGVRKVNVDTDCRMAITGAIRKLFAENPKEFDPRKYLKPAIEEMQKVCEARYEAFGAAGHADKIKVIPMSEMAKRYASGEL